MVLPWSARRRSSSRLPCSPQFVEVALLASKLDQLVACGGVALVGKAPQFLEVALLASKLDELINRILVTALGTFPQDG